MPFFIIFGNLGQPSGYIEVIDARDQADAVKKATKKHGRGIRKIYTKETCPPNLKLILQQVLDNKEEFSLRYSDFMRITDGQGSAFKS